MTARNLLILCPDEMRGDCLGVTGENPDVRTPHMDRLAGRGVNLARHFTCFPKCVPARTSMMTGRYAHTGGYRTIQQHLSHAEPDVLSQLIDSGRESAVFGLNHCWENMFEASQTPPELGPGQRGLRIDHHSWTGVYRDLMDAAQAELEPTAEERQAVELDRPLHPHTPYRGDVDVHWRSEAAVRQAEHFLGGGRDADRPFFLQLNLGPPHPPYAAPEPYYSLYDPEQIEPYPHELPSNAPLSLRKQREHRTGLDPDEGLLRKAQAVYYGMIARVDDWVGRIAAVLDEQNLWDDTVVVLLSDHGDFAGQYGLVEKWDTTFADCLTRVPCVVAAPGLPAGRRVDALTEHTDLADTCLNLLGQQPAWGTHGHDLGPLLRGEVPSIRDAVFAEGGHEAPMRARVNTTGPSGKQETYREAPESMARAKMVRTDRHKLVFRETDDHELYDLETDRWELNNRFDDPALADVREQLERRMLHWCLRTDTDRPHQPLVHA